MVIDQKVLRLPLTFKLGVRGKPFRFAGATVSPERAVPELGFAHDLAHLVATRLDQVPTFDGRAGFRSGLWKDRPDGLRMMSRLEANDEVVRLRVIDRAGHSSELDGDLLILVLGRRRVNGILILNLIQV